MKVPTVHLLMLLQATFLSAVMLFSSSAIAQNASDAGNNGGLFMHGVSDADAMPIDFGTLVGEDQKIYIDKGEKLVIGERTIKGDVVKMSGSNDVELSKTILPLARINELAGRSLRFFVWIKAANVVAKDNLWNGAPAVTISLYDNYSNKLISASSNFKTRGTYPWHCYYLDIDIPKSVQLSVADSNSSASDADNSLADLGIFVTKISEKCGLYVKLSNLGGGDAWFGGFSYKENNFKNKKKEGWMNTATGAMAPNPQYDELPVIMFYGLSDKDKWNFLNGNKNFKSIKTVSGVSEYIRKNGNDWFHIQKGIAMLPYIYVTSQLLNLADGMEDGWLEAVGKEVTALQDPETGFWKANGTPNLLCTFAIAQQCFSPKSIRRSDVKEITTPWNAVGSEAVLPRAEQIISTVLSCTVKNTPVWNQFALQPEDLGENIRDSRTDLGATTAAVRLLAIAASTLPTTSPTRQQVDAAIKEAYNYALSNFLLKSENGLWSDNNQSAVPSSNGSFFLELLDATKCLERRINIELPKPEFTFKKIPGAKERVTVVWNKKSNLINSLRIYAAPDDLQPELLTEKHLVGIIESPNTGLITSDPYLMCRKIATAARKYWGVTPNSVGAVYMESKLELLPKRIPTGKAGGRGLNVEAAAEFTSQVDEMGNPPALKYYVAGADLYGGMTPYYLLEDNTDDLNTLE